MEAYFQQHPSSSRGNSAPHDFLFEDDSLEYDYYPLESTDGSQSARKTEEASRPSLSQFRSMVQSNEQTSSRRHGNKVSTRTRQPPSSKRTLGPSEPSQVARRPRREIKLVKYRQPEPKKREEVFVEDRYPQEEHFQPQPQRRRRKVSLQPKQDTMQDVYNSGELVSDMTDISSFSPPKQIIQERRSPIQRPEENEENDDDDDQTASTFKPYTLKDYRRIKQMKEIKSLQPNLEREDIRAQKANRQRRMEFGRQLNAFNKHKIEETKRRKQEQTLQERRRQDRSLPQTSERTSSIPSPHDQTEPASKRERMKKYASRIPRPKLRKKEVVVEEENDDLLSDTACQEPSLLEQLEARHNQMRLASDQIKKELGLN